MSRKEKFFSLFGVKYRTKQFSADEGLRMMAGRQEISPTLLLSYTSVLHKGTYVELDSKESVNKHVADAAKIIAPRMALNGLIRIVDEFNFGFLDSWKGAKVPKRFQESAPSISSNNVHPVIAQLTNDKVATFRELEEYYSLEDAFKMLDAMIVSGINQALAMEESTKKR